MRLVLGFLGFLHLIWGIPQVAAPRWFFDHFPGLGHQWTAAYPPYNEHLTVDVGAAALALGIMLTLAAIVNDTKTTRTVLTGVTAFSALHFGYHIAHHGSLDGTDLAASLLSLTAGVIVPLGLLVLTLRKPNSTGVSG